MDTEQTADSIVHWLVGKRKYSEGDDPELAGLRAICSRVLTRQAGGRGLVVAIADARLADDPSHSLQSITHTAWQYIDARATAGGKATVRLVWVGPGTATPAAVTTLTAARESGYESDLLTWIVDTDTHRVVTDELRASLGDFNGIARQVHAVPLQASGAALSGDAGRPVFTYGLAALLVAIYCAEVWLSPGASFVDGPSPQALSTLGGTIATLVQAGQYWRVLTAPLLHANLLHVGFNCLALVLIGRLMEPLVGLRWMAGVFAVSALSGAMVSLQVNPPNIVSVGASGGIVGLFALAILVAFRLKDKVQQARLIRTALGTLIPTLIPSIGHAGSPGSLVVDYADHIGGAIAGVVSGSVLMLLQVRPRLAWLASVVPGTVGAAFFLGATLAIWPISELRQEYALVDLNWPPPGTNWQAGIDQELTRYPRDPRVLSMHATYLETLGNKAEARANLEAALSETRLLEDMFSPELTPLIKGLYAITLAETGDPQKSQQLFRELCAGPRTPKLSLMLVQANACR